MSDQKIEAEFLFLKPEYVDRWSYQLDNSHKHMIAEEQVYPYVKQFVPDVTERVSIVDIISRHQPFIISLKSGHVRELHLKEDTKDFHRAGIQKDLAKVAKGFTGEGNMLGDPSVYRSRSSRSNESAYDRKLRQMTRIDRDVDLSRHGVVR